MSNIDYTSPNPHYDYTDAFSRHCLRRESSPPIESYRLFLPDHGRMESCLVVFSTEGIAIIGDYTPQRHGSVSAYGYGVRWFAGRLAPGYLAEKFLSERFVPEIAAACLRSEIGGEVFPEHRRKSYEDIAEILEAGEVDAHWFFEQMADVADHEVDDLPGWAYDPVELGILVAIQRRFAEMYREMQLGDGEGGGA